MEACREAALEVEYLRKRIEAHKKLDAESKELIATLEARIATFELQVKHLKSANESGEKIAGVDEKLFKSYQDSIEAAKKEIARLTAKVAFWKRVATIGAPVALVVGALAGLAFSSRR